VAIRSAWHALVLSFIVNVEGGEENGERPARSLPAGATGTKKAVTPRHGP